MSEDNDLIVSIAASHPDNGSDESVIDRLTRGTGMLNHKKLLTSSSKLIDEFRRDYSYETPTNFEDVKSNILNSSDLREMISSLSVDNSVSESLKLMFTDLCLAEISRI